MAREVFVRFLIVGMLAFGGPMAHLAWFERTFVAGLAATAAAYAWMEAAL